MGKRKPFQLSRLREIGWALWDPIGLNGLEGTPDDEYDSYLLQAAGQLWKGAGVEEVARILASIEIEHMGLEDRSSAMSRATATAAAIGGYVVELRSQQP